MSSSDDNLSQHDVRGLEDFVYDTDEAEISDEDEDALQQLLLPVARFSNQVSLRDFWANGLQLGVQQMMSYLLCAVIVKSKLQRVHATYVANNYVMTAQPTMLWLGVIHNDLSC